MCSQRYRRNSIHMWKVKNFLDMLKFNMWVDLIDWYECECPCIWLQNLISECLSLSCWCFMASSWMFPPDVSSRTPPGHWTCTAPCCRTWSLPFLPSCWALCCTRSLSSRETACSSRKQPQEALWPSFPSHRAALSMAASSTPETRAWTVSVSCKSD